MRKLAILGILVATFFLFAGATEQAVNSLAGKLIGG